MQINSYTADPEIRRQENLVRTRLPNTPFHRGSWEAGYIKYNLRRLGLVWPRLSVHAKEAWRAEARMLYNANFADWHPGRISGANYPYVPRTVWHRDQPPLYRVYR